MSIQPTATWYNRYGAGVSELNGGGYDPGISGAGTNYADQDGPQLSLTDLVTAGSTTVTSVTGGFTSAMIGNCLRIAGDGYYFITARGSSNSITVDRNTGTNAAATGRVGGAWATLVNTFAGGTITQPALTSPIVDGNILYVRGAGSDNPSTPDYSYSAGDYAGGGSFNKFKIIGYNGRPLIKTSGLLFYGSHGYQLENFCHIHDASAIYYSYGLFGTPGVSINACVRNCKFDTNGVSDAVGICANDIIESLVTNSGTTSSSGTIGFGIILTGQGGNAQGCKVEKQRGSGIKLPNTLLTAVIGCEIVNNAQKGILAYTDNQTYPASIIGNTISNNGGDGINVPTTASLNSLKVVSNIITNNGGYGINIDNSDTTANNDRVKYILDYNTIYGNSGGPYHLVSGGAHDQLIDPQVVGSGDYTPTNAALEGTGFPASFP